MYAKTQLLIRQARIIDPSSQRDEVADLLIEEGRISRIGASLDGRGADIINAEGLWLLPGLVDTCVHLPEPGHHRAGTIASETQAAAAGGITHVCAPPDTDPVADSTAVIRLIRERAAQTALDRKSTRLNSSHVAISYAVFCLEKKTHIRAATTNTTS